MHVYDQDTLGQLSKYPLGGPHAIILSRWSRIHVKVLNSPALYVYQGCVIFGCASSSIMIYGVTMRPYKIFASRFICVMPSLL